ncbi:MAG: hypothetical protein HY784_17990, partial [Chloroflexi bacterium]|nr:hypothetical protein [Chloroflexota bacterium]
MPEMVVGAYKVLVAVDEAGVVKARMLRTGSAALGTPFERIKAMLGEDERLVVTTLDPALILPGSYLELWAPGQSARKATDLIAAFGQFTRLPRLLNPASLYDTLARAVREGVVVLRLPRADGSARTWWRLPPDDDTFRRPEIEVQPASVAVLHDLDPELLAPGRLDGLWPSSSGPLSLDRLRGLFDGARAPRPASPATLDEAVRLSVSRGLAMARLDGISLYRESLPDGPLPGSLELLPPPPALHGADLTPQSLPAAWDGERTSLLALSAALASLHGYGFPWGIRAQALDEALSLRLLELAPGSGPWPS